MTHDKFSPKNVQSKCVGCSATCCGIQGENKIPIARSCVMGISVAGCAVIASEWQLLSFCL